MGVFIDNGSAVANINSKGSCRSPLVRGLALTIWRFCITENLLYARKETRVPCVQNYAADKISRLEPDTLDFALKPEIFQELIETFNLTLEVIY